MKKRIRVGRTHDPHRGKRLGIQMIATYSPEACGRSERFFGMRQGRLPNELALHGTTDMDRANDFLKTYWAGFNQHFSVQTAASGSAFVAALDAPLHDILCVQEARRVRGDNGVRYDGMT